MKPRVGLEIHVRLSTRTKLFCACPNAAGGEPNARTCPVCLGLPGSLPVPGAAAVERGLLLALRLGAEPARVSVFERKAYFYPDLPRNYQITQVDHPLARGGALEHGPPGRWAPLPLERAHLEEDAGRLLHDGEALRVDFSRAGTPLLEIVTEPVLGGGEEAASAVHELRRLVRWCGAGEADLEAGDLRVDANVSLDRPDGSRGPRVELKNLNSLRALRRAVDAELQRQRAVLDAGGAVRSQTRGWDEAARRTVFLRDKESAPDYRCFPDPDLPPLRPDPGALARAAAEAGETPRARARSFVTEHGLPFDLADRLCESRALADLYAAVVAAGAAPHAAALWLDGETRARLNALGCGAEALQATPAATAELLRRIADGRLSPAAARQVYALLCERGGEVGSIVEAQHLAGPSAAELEAAVAAVLAESGEAVAQYRAGRVQVLHHLVGRVLARTGPGADAARVRALLLAALGAVEDS